MKRAVGFQIENSEGAAPTARVDLGKPAYRLGISRIRVGWEGHQLSVDMKADKPIYSVKETAQIQLQVKRPDGKAAANAQVAFAAVDEALLTLSPNPSWDILSAMMGERALDVLTSTAQMQVVGKRHYGRKALEPSGGGGGPHPRQFPACLVMASQCHLRCPRSCDNQRTLVRQFIRIPHGRDRP